ncbi:hypothetical protein WSK_0108 [Novosphingobium sp. Rr 2-17]|uniref:DUF4178 domain-containing protein n=1 Tax=Novosphingobium sp. Rr 2-17 TaxID=555793 RepID=UPI0002697AD3|nr:DUF4178 domain-containing protein [Novosphingobium sp. Rr 2-17]EIZ81163.1 hypothetical protein WSK_0108 [Novosphingobium sp. Rr 2-17]
MTAVRAIICPQCGGALEVRAAGYSVNLACQHCGSLLDVSRPEVALIEAHKRAARQFRLKLGRRGTLFEVEWEVVGALARKDEAYAWDEYLLFNPYAGYRWLVLSGAEWQFGTMMLDLPEGDDDTVTWRGERYIRDGAEGTTRTTAVLGEFYWRVRKGDRVAACLFERGKVILSREDGGGEVNWTQLIPVGAATVNAAFGLRDHKPRRRASAQPFAPFAVTARPTSDLSAMFAFALGALVLLLLAMAFISGPVDRASGSIDAPYGKTREGVKIGTISVQRPYQFVTVKAQTANISNTWVDLDYALVDRATGQSIDGYGMVEHYSGHDSDGYWSEGTLTDTTLFGQVRRGTYDVYVDAAAHGWPSDPSPASLGWSSSPQEITVSIQAETGALPWGNWWTAALLLFAFPCLALWHRFREEPR